MQMVYKLEGKWLYILRAINDAAIVWKEGIDAMRGLDVHYEEEAREWEKLTA